MKKQLLLVSALICALLTSCGGKIDEGGNGQTGSLSNDKTNITIGTFDGGVKDQWLKNAKAAFEEKYKDVVFEEGRKGVNIVIDVSSSYGGNAILANSLSTLDKDIYFTETVNYKALVNKGYCVDITDVYNTTIEGENKKIIDKLPTELQENLKVNNKLYGVPFWDGFYGFMYDKTLFKEEGLYLDATKASLTKPGQAPLSKGPDNKTGIIDGVDYSIDDGLPATYGEFTTWTTKLSSKGIKPFVYSAQFTSYVDRAIVNFWSDYEGKDNFYLNYSFDGTASDLIQEGQANPALENFMSPTTITESNGYLLQRQAGKYHALNFMFNNITESTAKGIGTHTEAQQNFINNCNSQGTKFAMIIDGSWWENEAKATIDSVKKITGGIRHDYSFMPIPKVNSEHLGEKMTITSNCDAYGFIKKGCGNEAACKEFMKFLHSDEQLKAFTKETSITRAFNAEWTESELNELTSFGRSLIEMKKTANIVYPLSDADIVAKNPSVFAYDVYPWATAASNSPFVDHKHNNTTATAYFDRLFSYYKGKWSNLL